MMIRLRGPYVALVLAALICTSCGDKNAVPPAGVAPTPVTAGTSVLSVTVTPSSILLTQGERATLAATVTAEAGVTDRSVTWSSSNTSIASVDANGIVTAVGQGTTTILATSRANAAVAGAAAVVVIAAATPPPPAASPSTTYGVTLTVTSDPQGHEPFANFTSVKLITCATSGTTVTITGAAPWVTVTGTVSASGSFTATGTGTVAGRSGVTVTATGTFSGNSFPEPSRWVQGCRTATKRYP